MTRSQEQSSVAALSPAMGGGKGSTTARVLGSAFAGISELLLFHPVDTVAKRLMSNTTNVSVSGQSLTATAANLNQIIFKDKAGQPIIRRYASLFPGLGYGAGYKILQRVYKFGGQPIVRDAMTKSFGDSFANTFGEKKGKALLYAFAGSLMGIGEIVLLPLDVLKIKAQTNPESLKGRGVMEIFRTEGMGLYRGAGWTAGRNAPGSFALFGGSSFTKEFVFGLENYGDATFLQDALASVAGATASITVAAPLDVIKTRVQNRPFDSPESGVTILRNLVRNEGKKTWKRGAPQAFAQKLYQILEVESTDHIAWNDTGSAFNIVNMEVFTEQILTKYFRHSKFLSFTRQLNLYGFRKVVTCGLDEWAYEHKCFLRDRPDLLDFVRRTLAPASKGKVPAPEEEAANVRRKLAPASKGKVPAPEEEAAKEQPPTAQAPASKVKVPVPEEEAAKEQPPTSQQIQLPGKTLQKACEEEMQRAQIIIDKLDTPVEVKVKFQKVQELLRRNSQLIADIEQRHQHASSSFNTPQHELGQAGQLIQELNSNLTEVVKIYASFSHIEEHAS